MNRRTYLDWLRGVAVVIMIEAHTLDAWTQPADRHSHIYGWSMVLAGYGAPFFMFLAGIAMALAGGARERKGMAAKAVAAAARRRGWEIFGLAFLFRLQAMIVSGGTLAGLLKVDILNVMGLSMVAAAVAWGLVGSRPARGALLAALAVACTMVTPLVREAAWVNDLPGGIAAYIRPIPGRTTFTLFPWAGFLLAGGAVGTWLDAARRNEDERRLVLSVAVIGVLLAVGGYGASYLPSLYARSEFWTSSPTYFFVRLGLLLISIPIAYGWNAAWPGWSPLQDFGRSSLFVYWVHIELVYGLISTPLHRALSFNAAVAGFGVFTVLMFLLVKVKERVLVRWASREPSPRWPQAQRQ